MRVEVTIDDKNANTSSLSDELKHRQKDLLEDVINYWYNDSQEKTSSKSQ